ncbi:MAG: AraC family transcriptional regulator [Acidobacteriota bacterium]|nr:AraC family transcriptional regulator [Acidobacteriota bacterium]
MVQQNVRQITFGQEISSLNLNGYVLTETFHAPHLILPRHDHDCATIDLTLDGSFREIIGNRPQECETDSFLVKPPGESHDNKYGEKGAHCLIIRFLPARFDDICSFTNLFNAPTHLTGGTPFIIGKRIYHEFRGQTNGFELIIEGLILEMLGQTARQNKLRDFSPPPRWLKEAQELIHQHFTENISLYSIANVVQIHPSHLARVFRKYFQCSIGEYVRRLRIEYAAQEILKSDLSLADIALNAGFSDQSHFTHEFKRRMRITPAEYKKIYNCTAHTKTH